MRTRPSTLVALVAVLVAAVPLTACSSGGSGPAPATSTAAPTLTVITSSPVPTAPTSTAPVPDASPAGLVPLWPFTTPAQAAAWQATYRSAAQQPWHLDADRTALAFCRDHLGYTEIDRVTTRSVSGTDARLGVGWKGEDGAPHTVGELHLVRFGPAQDAPWVVVGSEDTYLTLTTPRYGATVTLPLTVGGAITGVDESLRVKVLGPASATPLAEVAGIPAGGERTPWTTTLTFSAPSGTVATITVSTGGHLMDVERFAITAVRVA